MGQGSVQEVPKLADPYASLPRLGAWEIRRKARCFTERTAVAVDGFAIRHSTMMSDPAFVALGAMFEAMEMSGTLPKQTELVMVALLPKPAGGFRPIGLYPAVYRPWGRCRRDLAVSWERSNDRHYYAAGQHTGAGDVIWRQAMLSEAGVQQGLCCASVLWDMAKFYESFRHEQLLQ